jgi:hypothetical protein
VGFIGLQWADKWENCHEILVGKDINEADGHGVFQGMIPEIWKYCETQENLSLCGWFRGEY